MDKTKNIVKPSTIILNRARKHITDDMTVKEARKIEAARSAAAAFYLAAAGIELVTVRMRVLGLRDPQDEFIIRYIEDDGHMLRDVKFSKKELEKQH